MVIAIISVLISIVSISFTEARKGTRDGVRMTALSELQLAIEKYKAQKGSTRIKVAGWRELIGPGRVAIRQMVG